MYQRFLKFPAQTAGRCSDVPEGAANMAEAISSNFIYNIIDDDLKSGKHPEGIHTRFPPEPNGYLHIGHAKSICLNFGTAEKYAGLCNLRFDDTNPTKEDTEYVDSIQEDIKWLGFSWGDRRYYASDYFEKLYEYACLRRRSHGRGDPRLSRHSDGAGQGEPLPQSQRRGKPRALPAHEGGRVP